MATMATIITSKNINYYMCENCDFKCSKKGDYNRHLYTRKHQIATNSNIQYIKNIASYMCENCNKEYKDRSGLWRHKKTCYIHEKKETQDKTTKINEKNSNSSGIEIDKELLIKMLLKNQEVMDKMMEILPTIGNNSHNTNTITNNTNNTQNFNIQMFLNEHCKNAMNLTDFIDTLPITAETYDSTIDNGLTKTITNMITNGLSQLDVLERPIHCTDATRKTLYVKENNVWDKDNELIKILLGIRNIASKQRTLITKWRDVNHGWDTDDKIQTRFTSLVCNSMEDIENDVKETNKIIRSLSKTVYLDNDMKKQYLE